MGGRFRSPAPRTSLDDLTASRRRDRSRPGRRRPRPRLLILGEGRLVAALPCEITCAHVCRVVPILLGLPARFSRVIRARRGWSPRNPVKNWRKATLFDDRRRVERLASGQRDYCSSLARVLLENMAPAGRCRSPAKRPTTAGLPGANGHTWMVHSGRGVAVATDPRRQPRPRGRSGARGRATVLGLTDRDLGYRATRRRANT